MARVIGGDGATGRRGLALIVQVTAEVTAEVTACLRRPPLERDFWSLVLCMTSATAAGTTTVAVLDSEFREVRTITSAQELALFDRLWSDRTAQKETTLRPLYRVSIYRNGRSVRWLYDPVGLAQVLSKAKKPVYRLQSVDDLNALLAISSRANQPP